MRRRNARSLVAARFQLEATRLARLHTLNSSVEQLSTLTEEDWRTIQTSFKDLLDSKPEKLPSFIENYSDLSIEGVYQLAVADSIYSWIHN